MNSYQQPVDKYVQNSKLRSRHAQVIHMLDWRAMLLGKSPSGAQRKPLKRIACAVALALVGAVSIGCSPLEAGSIDAIEPKAYIRLHYSKKQALCLIKLYGKESAFNRLAIGNENGSIKAYGIPQLKSAFIKDLSANKQIDYGMKYVAHRYGTPCKAWAHSKKRGWY